ncbi:hypothetical protein CERSUDRAFT_111496 [Gelatoporia subvermispora B]|uniref:Pre-rRNA-processing protein RIX1 n=1 Tax=Ceriporiopsis subvermispora (strain B) TaxID=914234 RepID=M2R938_CERS8|nr:hypothetical protein CERSUDRAFT_111496 [Gelatoporia subvermispora B]
MLEGAQSWLGVALPLLPKNEPVPVVKASIRLLRYIFANGSDVPEFQRHLCIPNVPKFSSALVTVANQHGDIDVKVLSIETLTHLIQVYPSLHRSLHAGISTMALHYLNGPNPRPIPPIVVQAASQLYSVLHLTGGKVGAANLWRKSLDDTVNFAWASLMRLRTTYKPPAPATTILTPGPSNEDPLVAIPLHLERLRAAIRVLKDHCRTITPRPVTFPIGAAVRLCMTLLSCARDEEAQGPIDQTLRNLEAAIVPALWTLACELIVDLAASMNTLLTPHVPRLFSYLSYHLEQKRTPSQHISVLRSVISLLQHTHALHDPTLSSRLARTVLPLLSVILSSEHQAPDGTAQSTLQNKGRKGKKRARGYEGDEVFKVTREVVCPKPEDGDALIAAFRAIDLVVRKAPLTPAIHSVVARTMLSIYLALPRIPPGILSPDTTLHTKIYAEVQIIALGLASGTSSTMSKSMALAINTVLHGTRELSQPIIQREIDLLLHPRMPPLVRSLPHVETISLFRAEESQEEMDTRHALGLRTEEDSSHPASSDAMAAVHSPPVITRDRRQTEATSDIPAAGTSTTISVSSSVAPPRSAPTQIPAPYVPAATSRSDAIDTILQAAEHPRSVAPMPQRTSAVPSLPAPLASVGQPSKASSIETPTNTSSSIPSGNKATVTAPIDEDDDDDEPMPTINMESDSDDSD